MRDDWSWKKFFSGFFNGKNYAKAVVLMFCSAIIIILCFSTYSFIKSKFQKPTQQVGENYGTITTTNTDKKSWSLLNLFNF